MRPAKSPLTSPSDPAGGPHIPWPVALLFRGLYLSLRGTTGNLPKAWLTSADCPVPRLYRKQHQVETG